MKKLSVRVFAAMLCALAVFTSCLRQTSNISDNVGVGRDTKDSSESPHSTDSENDSDSGNSYTPPPLDNHTDTDSESLDLTSPVSVWELKDGVFTYNIPMPVRDLSDLSDIKSASTALFEDQGNDTTGSWFFGKVERNLETGEVTYVWDRYKSTLDAIDEYGGIYRGSSEEKVCYITFDCGYENGYTGKILDTLEAKNVPAIFFLTGHYMRTEEELVNRMIDEGHLIGNHTVNHKNMTDVSAETFIYEIETFENEFYEKYPNGQPLKYYRPPMGACNEWSLKMADKMDICTVMWSFAYYDYDVENQPEVSVALEKAKKGLHNGCVYLFHTESSTNTAMLGDLIDWIRDQGYEILPICEIK